MNTKKIVTVFLAMVLVFSLSMTSFADGGSKCGSKCGIRGGGGHHGYKKVLDGKFYTLVTLIYKNKEELGITEEQEATIKDTKIALEKAVITYDARISILEIDIKGVLWEDSIDSAKAEKLIESEYEIKKAKAKMIVGSIAKLKASLSPAQLEKLEKLYIESM